ncbi:MAG TPA: M56 family metallopeptidase [Phenylobacterium sp.]|uniref:M56 family metallopeptidase n=1 Tax=Phenylobacterium sp. TaxID=1871053 RepID=UPI002D71B296|nr:M56 family metallopeptidase [Phenylobacterium sp.]HZZ69110.1 M56 family metallopeptidase [Phenylobacterium sp.]
MQQLLASYLLNAAWQIPVVALCAFLVSRFGGLSPRARNRLWLSFLAIAAVLPAVSLSALLPHAEPTVARVPVEALAAAPAVTPTANFVPSAEPAIRLAGWSAATMIAVFAVVALALAVRLAVAGLAARRLVRDSRPADLPAEVLQAVQRLAQAHDCAAPPIRRSDRVASPAVVGAFSPVILIPADFTAEGDDLRAALLHETAHVIRHDYAVNLVSEVLTLPVCWHPALMALKAGVSRSRELACDAMAAGEMVSPKAYAKCLVSLAQTLGAAAAAPHNVALAVGLFGRSDLEDRLMQLMTPREAEAPAVRAARLCGLAAVGASLLGSAALLHVTPVFAQGVAAPSAMTALPLARPSPAATAAVSQARADAVKPDTAKIGPDEAPVKRKGHVIISHNGILMMDAEPSGYHHSFTSADGREFEVITDDPKDLTPEEEQHWEQAVEHAQARAAEAMKKVNSPEFQAKIAAAVKAGAEAEARVNSPEFKARIAAAQKAGEDAERMVNSPEFKAKIAAAEARGAEAERMVNSPEFKAKIAAAQKAGEDAQRMVNSPEFKARIAAAQKAGAEAAARVNSPAFRARMEELGERMAHQFDDPPLAATAP